MRTLFSCWTLSERTGAELHLVELAGAMQRLGCEVTIHAVVAGPLARQAQAQGLTVVKRLKGLAAPDLIHAQSQPALIEALAAFPQTPAIQVVHDATAPLDEPYLFHRVLRHVAVDQRCLGRIEAAGIVPERQAVRLNFVDLERFSARGPLPVQPRRALVFSNYAQDGETLEFIRAACVGAGIALDVIGLGVGRPMEAPEQLLGDYDIVFAKARAAIEAMAVGTAVVLCDFAGLGPMVTTGEFARLRECNFGAGVLTDPVTVEGLARQIARYDVADAGQVSALIREQAGLKAAALDWLELHHAIADEPFRTDRQNERAQLIKDGRRWDGLRRVDWLRRRLSGARDSALYKAGRGLWRVLGSPGQVAGTPRRRL